MSIRIVDEGVETTRPHVVRPEHINTKVHFWDAFGDEATEVSASWIVRLCQKLDGWKSFTPEEIENFYRANSKHKGFSFNRLIGYGFVDGSGVDGKCRVTHDFICQCFKASPAEELFAQTKAV